MSTVPPGTACWADLATPDLADARRFYPELFGWTGRITPATIPPRVARAEEAKPKP
ncbi:hypothetical protein GCM10011608_54650 [Micromonospora sonchi]|uniref:VOC family protein n=1 Tax=Micromonospora sonchi TaxID=1763543 RepID=A0A917X4C1_9ACTN|nr:hypothetical protein GCM10011608_54650 [Micromonospora sonchi]